MPTVEERLAAMGLTVHEVVPPVAAYVPAKVSGRYVFTAGQLPCVDGVLVGAGNPDGRSHQDGPGGLLHGDTEAMRLPAAVAPA
mgnify:CR=1 FL=1